MTDKKDSIRPWHAFAVAFPLAYVHFALLAFWPGGTVAVALIYGAVHVLLAALWWRRGDRGAAATLLATALVIGLAGRTLYLAMVH